MTLNGATPPPCTGATWGELTAEDPRLAYNLSIPVPCATGGGPFAFAARLFPGQYTVYARINDGEILVVADGLTVDAPRSDLALAASTVLHAVSGIVTKNRALPASGCTPPEARATEELTDATRGSSVTIPVPCAAGAFSFDGLAPPGSYRVTIRGAASDLPSLGYVAPAALVVAGPVTALVYDVPTRLVSGTVTLEGGAPGCTARTAASITFIDPATHMTFALPATCDDAGAARFAGELFPGSYDVVVFGAASAIPATGYLGASGVAVP